MTWIACKDRMPKQDYVVLIFVPDNQYSMEGSGMYKAYWIDKSQEWYSANKNQYFLKSKVTHWMPMPQPPIPYTSHRGRKK